MTHPLLRNLPKNIHKHVNSTAYSDKKGIGDDASNVRHDRFSRFGMRLFIKGMLHLSKKQIIDDQKPPVNKDRVDMDDMNKFVYDKSLLKNRYCIIHKCACKNPCIDCCNEVKS